MILQTKQKLNTEQLITGTKISSTKDFVIGFAFFFWLIFVNFFKQTSLALKMMNPQKNTSGQIGQSQSSVFRLLWQSQGKQQNSLQVSWVASKVLCQGQISNCAKDIGHRGYFLEAPQCPLNGEDLLTKNKQSPV